MPFDEDPSDSRSELDMCIDEIQQLKVENEELREALLQHRMDLHQRSGRPCPTCRRSAKILGLDVPSECAKGEWDKQALKG